MVHSLCHRDYRSLELRVKLTILAVVTVFSTHLAMAQVSTVASLSPKTTLPISFTRSIDANHVHAGDSISAKLTQPVHLANGQVIPAGAHVAGHVVTASGFAFDPTPYAKQKQSALSIHFDSVDGNGVHLPLNVYVRAMADPLTAWDARRPKPSDEDPLGTTQQIGGDLVTPSQSGVMSQDGDIVGYQRHGGIYAHLISASANGSGSCDASDTEQSMGLFSASACGLYGFTDVALADTGRSGEASTLTLISRRHSPRVWANSMALLEVLSPENAAVVSP
jgi:hypothetical protein